MERRDAAEGDLGEQEEYQRNTSGYLPSIWLPPGSTHADPTLAAGYSNWTNSPSKREPASRNIVSR